MAATMCLRTYCRLLSRRNSVTQTLPHRHTRRYSVKNVKLQNEKLKERQTQVELKKKKLLSSNTVSSTEQHKKYGRMEDRKINHEQHTIPFSKLNRNRHLCENCTLSFWEMIQNRMEEANTHYAMSKENLSNLDFEIRKNLQSFHVTSRDLMVRGTNKEGCKWLTQGERFTGVSRIAESPYNIVNILQRVQDVNLQLEELDHFLQQTRGHQIAYFMVFNEIRNVLVKKQPDLSIGLHGSAVTNLGYRGSDLDIVVDTYNFDKKHVFDWIKGSLLEVDSLDIGFSFPWARVPIINVQHRPTKISCDIAVDAVRNRNPMVNSEILYTMGILDERFSSCVRIIKYWASTRGICESGANFTPHGITWTLMTLFYFQQKGILPAVCKLYQHEIGCNESRRVKLSSWICNLCQPTGTPEMRSIDSITEDLLKENHESIVDLLKGFCDFYSVFDFNGKGLSVYHGSAYQRFQRRGAMEIPLQLKECYSSNVAQNVDKVMMKRVRKELLNLYQALNDNRFASLLRGNPNQVTKVNRRRKGKKDK